MRRIFCDKCGAQITAKNQCPADAWYLDLRRYEIDGKSNYRSYRPIRLRVTEIKAVQSGSNPAGDHGDDIDLCKYCLFDVFAHLDDRPKAEPPKFEIDQKAFLMALDSYGQAASDGEGVLAARVRVLDLIGLTDAAG